jgi:pseudaminic acid CMP-transferase
MNIAVIPARGGSVRIPRKNVRDFCGKPMIAWPIKIAKDSGLFDRILVSTDDEEIAEKSKHFGAEVPFMRPKNLSDDYTGIIDVMSHAVTWMSNKKWKINAVCCIYPTSIFLTINDLKKGLELLNTENWSYTFSATEFEHSIFRSFKVLPNGGVEMFFPENYSARSQDLPEALHDAAQFYWGNPECWIKNMKIFESYSYPIKIPFWRVQDIDTENDFKKAEILFKSLKQ